MSVSSGDFATEIGFRRSEPAPSFDTAGCWYELGRRYEHGDCGEEVDLAAAAYWYRQGALVGHAEAANALGYLYATGQGVPQDPATAVAWFRRAAARGHADAQANLGAMYGEGRGVPRDSDEALKWLQLAAHQGSPEAQAFLSRAYAEGLYGVEVDAQQATYWRHNAVFARARRAHHGG